MQTVRIFTPATVANLSCGFDVLGCCLDTVGDEMVLHKNSSGDVRISKIDGADLPKEAHLNVASVAVQSLLDQLGDETTGFDIEIYKKIKAGSGIGSSAASSAGAVWAANYLMGSPFTNKQLISCAMEGEKVASGNAHADNVAPALLGGFTLVRSYVPLDVLKLHTPSDLYVTVIHPQIEIKTADARKVIKPNITLKKAIHQWGNLGGFVTGLFTEDYDLLGRSLEDVIIEPLRSMLIPNFRKVKQAALEAGALGCGISGSGPSIFALNKGKDTALKVKEAMDTAYQQIGIEFDLHVSPINTEGVRCLFSE